MTFFRGYIRTHGKSPIDKFKDVDLRSLDEVKDLDSYAGVLDKNTVLIDVDDAKQAQRLFDMVKSMELCCQVRQTTRGKHFYFVNDGFWEKCGGNNLLAIGIHADIKVGVKNSIAILKKDGVDREIIYDNYDLFENYEAPPFWLRPVSSKLELFDLDDGDGRNDALFKYILPLQEAGFTKDEILKILELVNNWIFAKSLSKSEFETITRDEAFDKALVPNFYEGKRFAFEKLGDYVIRQFHIKRINQQLHVYEDGVYVDGVNKIKKAILSVIRELSRDKRNEVLEYIDIMVDKEENLGTSNYIAFKNGILDLDTGKMMAFSPDIVVVNRIPHNYNPTVKCDLVDETLTNLACGDESIKKLLIEMVGYCMYRRNELRKAFILTGEKNNGKSTFIDMIGWMLGKENYSTLDLKDLNHTFRPAMMFRKLANLGDDIGDEFINDTSIFKKFVSGDPVTVENKNKDPFTFTNYAKMIFAANTLPRVKDRTGAVLDRLVIIPFKANFKSSANYKPFIKDELRDERAIERLIYLGVEALKGVLARRGFTQSEAVDKELDSYDKGNNPVRIFFEEVDMSEIERESVNAWYTKYTEFCLANGLSALSKIEFSKLMIKQYNLKSVVRKIDGKAVRFYARA